MLELTKILEKMNEYRLAVQYFRFCLKRISEYKDNNLQRGIESKLDLFLPFSLTCSNEKIKKTNKIMKNKYIEYKNKISSKIRTNERKSTNRQILNNEEAQEEEYETLDALFVYFSDDNKSTYFY